MIRRKRKAVRSLILVPRACEIKGSFDLCHDSGLSADERPGVGTAKYHDCWAWDKEMPHVETLANEDWL
jgi:hypothetical protein